jgi:hypothetical protein
VIGACIAIVAVGVGVFALKQGIEGAAYDANSDESLDSRERGSQTVFIVTRIVTSADIFGYF